MDYVLLQRMIGVFDGRNEIDGSIAVDHNETEWRFTPREAWKPASYRITADNTLEDISGNHLDPRRRRIGDERADPCTGAR